MPSLTLSSTIPKSATAFDVPVSSVGIDALGEDLARACRLQGFKGEIGDTLVVSAPATEALQVLVGIGDPDELDIHALRSAAAAYIRAVGSHQAVATTLAGAAGDLDPGAALQAVVEGVALASYRYLPLKSDPTSTLRKISVVAKFSGAKAAFTSAKALVDAVALARDLGNEPGGSLIPSAFVGQSQGSGGIDRPEGHRMGRETHRQGALGWDAVRQQGIHPSGASPDADLHTEGARRQRTSPSSARASRSTPVVCPSRPPPA